MNIFKKYASWFGWNWVWRRFDAALLSVIIGLQTIRSYIIRICL